MKKVFLVMLSSFLLFSLMACDSSSANLDETTSENTLSFEALSNGVIRVEDGSGYFPLEDGTLSFAFLGEATEIIVPAEFDGKTVTEISPEAFKYQTALRSVTLPNTIRVIGKQAFYGCHSLSEINLPESIQTIEKEAFSGCKLLSEISLPTSIQSIEYKAFAYCTSLKRATIPGGLEDYGTFLGSGLEAVTLLEGVEQIPDGTFDGTNLKELILPNSVRRIGVNAFLGCKALEKVILNDGLQEIAVYAFANTGLKEILIPASVSHIIEYTFSGCETLEHVYFEGDAPEDYLGNYGSADLSYTVHYHEGAAGFTSPEWCGRPTGLW